MERRLAAILAADVVGYSMLIGEDEAGTLAALRHLRGELFVPIISKYRGNIIKSMGDGWLVEFSNATDAVACAIAVQERLSRDTPIRIRVGVHIGDITFEDEDLFGDGVNIASRLQEVAAPGAIAISDFTWRAIDGKLAAGFSTLGPQKLKNIALPITAYGWRMHGSATAGPPEKPSYIPRIAVTPFENIGTNQGDDYLSSGISDDIVTELAHYPYLETVRRSTLIGQQESADDFDEISRTLGVDYMLEGKVLRANERVRITVRLIHIPNGRQIWAERYDRELEDLFDIQDEITQKIFAAILPEISINQQNMARRKYLPDLSSRELIWRGIWHFSKMSREDMETARRFFEEAIAQDPEFALPHCWLALAEFNTVILGWQPDPLLGIETAARHSRTAIQLDHKSPEGYMAYATALLLERDFDKSLEAAQKAIELTPFYATAHFILGACKGLAGDASEAVDSLNTAIALSPRDQFMFYFENSLSEAKYRLGDYAACEKWARASILENPDLSHSRFNYAAALARQGKKEQASKALKEALEIMPDADRDFFEMGWPYSDPADLEHLLDSLRIAGLEGL